jgi:hypothetical protein
MDDLFPAQALAEKILAASADWLSTIPEFDWRHLGLGFVRLQVSDRIRLHVWDSRLRETVGISAMHDHHWSLRSYVLSGRVEQYRYTIADAGERYLMKRYDRDGNTSPGEWVLLHRGPLEAYKPGEVYEQDPGEIHESVPANGTVTLVERVPCADLPFTRAFWPSEEAASVEVERRATRTEVMQACTLALEGWDPLPQREPRMTAPLG